MIPADLFSANFGLLWRLRRDSQQLRKQLWAQRYWFWWTETCNLCVAFVLNGGTYVCFSKFYEWWTLWWLRYLRLQVLQEMLQDKDRDKNHCSFPPTCWRDENCQDSCKSETSNIELSQQWSYSQFRYALLNDFTNNCTTFKRGQWE